jgi:predicted esterase
MVPFEPASLPDLAGRAILLSAGEEDPIIPQALTARLGELFREAGADLTLSWYDAGHGLVQAEITAAREWVARWEGKWAARGSNPGHPD